jgi:hypothetical protein
LAEYIAGAGDARGSGIVVGGGRGIDGRPFSAYIRSNVEERSARASSASRLTVRSKVGGRDALLRVDEHRHRELRVAPSSHALDLPPGYHHDTRRRGASGGATLRIADVGEDLFDDAARW